MPYLTPEQPDAPMGVKQFAEQRHEVRRIRDRHRNDPTVFKE